MHRNRKIRVLIVDDSAIVRRILAEALVNESDIEVIGAAPDPYIARDKILVLDPDVLTLDIEMPRMDGLTFLKKLMQFHPLPAVVISSLTQPSCQAAIQALEYGAVEVLAKPGGPYSVGDLSHTLPQKIRAAAAARLKGQTNECRENQVHSVLAGPEPDPNTVMAIGASTGGTEAITSVLTRLPESSPGLVIVQHIPPRFSRAFAERLNRLCKLSVKEAEDGDALRPGMALVAPGDVHMLLRRRTGGYYVNVKTGPKVCYQRPSVDVLFLSVAEACGPEAVGVLLTGMGADGAKGLLTMRQAGARTIAQDETTSVVYGMPREAANIGAAERILALEQIPGAMLEPREASQLTKLQSNGAIR